MADDIPAPGALRTMLLKDLRATLRAMDSLAFHLEIEKKSKKTRQQAAARRLQIHNTILKLENAELAQIRDGLERHGAEIERARAGLESALKRVRDAQRLIAAAGRVLDVAAKVVKVLPV